MLDLKGRLIRALPPENDDEQQPPSEQDPAMQRGMRVAVPSKIPGVKASESPPALQDSPPDMGIAKFGRRPGVSGDAPIAPLAKPRPAVFVAPAAPNQALRPFAQVSPALSRPPIQSATSAPGTAAQTEAPRSELADTISHVQRLRARPDPLAEAQARDRSDAAFENASRDINATFNRDMMPERRMPSAVGELSQRLSLQRGQTAANIQAEEGNAGSATSRSLQELIRGSMPELAAKMGPNLGKLSARQLKQMLPFVTELAKGKRGAEVDPALSRERNAAADLAEQKKYNLAHPAPHVEKPSEKLAGIRTQLGQAKLGALEATDFEKDDPNGPTLHEGEAPRLQTHRAAVDALSGLADELKAEYKKNPKSFSATDAAGRMKVMQAQLQPQITAAGGFGNFTQGHQELTSALADPSAWQNWLNSGRLPEQLEQVKRDARSNLDAHAHSLGRHFSPKGGGQKSHAAVGPATNAHPEDTAAIAWAKAHPDDPRAEKIFSLNP